MARIPATISHIVPPTIQAASQKAANTGIHVSHSIIEPDIHTRLPRPVGQLMPNLILLAFQPGLRRGRASRFYSGFRQSAVSGRGRLSGHQRFQEPPSPPVGRE